MQDIWYVIPFIISQVLLWRFKAVSTFKYKFKVLWIWIYTDLELILYAIIVVYHSLAKTIFMLFDISLNIQNMVAEKQLSFAS